MRDDSSCMDAGRVQPVGVTLPPVVMSWSSTSKGIRAVDMANHLPINPKYLTPSLPSEGLP